MLRRSLILFAVTFTAALVHAQTDVSGTWSGTVSQQKQCPGSTITVTANVTLVLQQSGSNVSGEMSFNEPAAGCAAAQSFSSGISGTASGSQLTATITLPDASTTQMTASVAGSQMSVSFSVTGGGTGSAVTGVLTRQGTTTTSDFSGNYTGTYQLTVGSGGCQFTSSGPMSLSITQSGTSLTASGVATNITAIQTQTPCTPFVTNLTLNITGTVSGSTFTGTDPSGVSVTGGLSGNTLSASFSQPAGTNHAGASGTFTVTRGTTTTGNDFSGSWSGSVSGTLPCGGDPTAMIPTTATLTQSGAIVTGSIVVQNGLCAGGSTFTVPVNATLLAPNEFIGEFSGGGVTNGAVAGVLATNGYMGLGIAFTNSSGQDVSVGGALTGGNGPQLPLAINSFSASLSTIRSGQTSTLAWSVQGASSVTIDQGIGTVASFGSKDVSPSATTTYTLTAMQGSTTVTSQVTITVLTGPIVNVTAFPSSMLQQANTVGGSTSYSLTNSGSASATVTLSQNGNFFTQSPTSFTIAPGASQTVTITGTAQAAGSYEGASIVSANGTTVQVPVKLLSAAPPTGTVTATPPAPRVDVAAPSGGTPSGSVQFTNNGTATLTGILSSDVPWIIPQSGVVTIAPGATGTFTFQIDRTKRPDSSAPIGSVEGNLTLSFLSGSGGSFAATPLDNTTVVPSVSIVKIVDTAQPTVTSAGIPSLGAGEVALFVAGAGHVAGSGGTQFVSDVNVLNVQGTKSIDDLKMYYTPSTGSATSSKATSLPSVPGSVSVAVADVVKSVFSGTNEVGTVQIRSKDADKLAVAATVLTPNNPAGIFGNAIPVFRSDRAVAASNTLVLTGLRKDSTTHTNLYIQETAGSPATVQIDYLDVNGATVMSTPQSIDAFKLLQINDAVPTSAVAAVITNTSTAGGKISAYATPVDQTSTDTWAIADWSKQYAYAGSDPVIIPIAGSVHGANNTFYRTDVSITNRGTSAASGTLKYVTRDGRQITKTINVGAKATSLLNDVVGTGLFGVSGDSTGYVIVTPASGSSFAVASRTYNTVGSSAASFGTGVPTLAAASALHVGSTRPIAGLEDASRTTVVAGKPGTFRTNFAVMETTGQAVTVRVTFRFTFPAGAKAQGVGAASRDYALSGGAFLMLNSIAGEILGPARLQYGDLTNVEADFQVVSGGGAVMLFTSSVDNATGDSILRTE